MTAPSVNSTVTAQGIGAGGQPGAVAAPGGSGEILAICMSNTSAQTWSSPGFVDVGVGATESGLSIATLRHSSPGAGPFTFTRSATSTGALVILVRLIAAGTVQIGDADSATGDLTLPSLNVSGNELLFLQVVARIVIAGITWTQPPGTTLVTDSTTSGIAYEYAVGYDVVNAGAGPTATGSRFWDQSGIGGATRGVGIIINPLTTATGSLDLTAAATAAGPASATGALTLSATAIAAAQATATAALALNGSATATVAASGATGSLTLTGTATAAARAGAATGSLSLAATGTASASPSASGSLSLGASATATASPSAGGSLTLGASGTAVAAATATGALSLTATADAAPSGIVATGALALSATGTATTPAVATGALSLDATATASAPATTSGGLTLTATGTARAPATATGSITLDATGEAAVISIGSIELTASGNAGAGSGGASGSLDLLASLTAQGQAAAAATLQLLASANAQAEPIAQGSIELLAAGSAGGQVGGATALIELVATGDAHPTPVPRDFTFTVELLPARSSAALAPARWTATLEDS